MTDDRPLLRRWAVKLKTGDRDPETVHVFSATANSAGASAAVKLRRRLSVVIDHRRSITVLDVREAP